MEFHTDIGCPSKGYVLANRWEFKVEHNPDDFTAVHIIDGMAHFRMDKLIKDSVTPDQLRKYFIHPIPNGFRRDPPSITLLPGGDAITYQIVDREQQLNFTGGQVYNATKIEIEMTREYTRPVLSDAISSNPNIFEKTIRFLIKALVPGLPI